MVRNSFISFEVPAQKWSQYQSDLHSEGRPWVDGKRGFIEGTAVKANPDSDEAKLQVKFYVPPFMPIVPVVGDYWVLYLNGD
ncbi:Temperature-induced lipocalin-1, partial [Cucurbita argyrosperma subsp. sororia]